MVRRLCYRKIDRHKGLVCVIVEEGSSGLEYFENEPFELRWYRFDPCDSERAEVEPLLNLDNQPRDWEVVIDIAGLLRPNKGPQVRLTEDTGSGQSRPGSDRSAGETHEIVLHGAVLRDPPSGRHVINRE